MAEVFCGASAAVAAPCDAVPVASCTAQPLEVFQLPEPQVLASRPIKLDAKRLHWVCCTDDADWASRVLLVVSRTDGSVSGPIENCRHAVAKDASAISGGTGVDAVWPDANKNLVAAIYGPSDAARIGAVLSCSAAVPPVPDGSQSIGKLWLLSVEAKDIPDEK